MKKIFNIVIGITVVGIMVYTMFYLFKKSEEKPVLYKVETPFKTNIIKKTVATGSVVPREEIEIKPQVSGIVDKLYVKAGNMVKKGDLIAKVKIVPTMLSLNNAESQIKQAKISLDNAEIDFNRQKKLFDASVIAAAEFQKTKQALDLAKQSYETARDNLDIVKEGATKSASASSNTLIKSTVSGMVLDVPIKEGNSVIEANNFNAGTSIATVADMTNMIFEGKIDESEVGKIHEGMELMLSIGAIQGETYKAVLDYIAPKGKEEAGAIQFEIKATVEIPENSFIRAGYSANADIVLDKKDNVLAIKEGLLHFSGDSIFVEVEMGEQIFEKRLVKTGISNGIDIEILSGITESDKLKGSEIVEEKSKRR